ncbi:hypothetical protein LXL04_036167 [Taraxacum kok-saghyz]
MDRYYWMYKAPRMSKPYLNGVENFISVAEANRVNNESRSISCPYNNCKNFLSFIDTGEIEYHLLHDGFVPNYTCWSRHGESLLDCSTSSNNLHSNENTFNNDSYLDDDDHHSNDRNDNFNEMFDDMETNMGADEQEKLHRLFDEAETPLYKGSRFMKLDVVLKLLNLKLKHGWSDKSFTSLLELLHDLFPEDNGLPISTYQAKKLMCPMGLEVERIHACPNNCMLFRKEFENKHNCVSCGASRYKRKKDSDEVDDDVTKNGPPAKMLWYLPIIPRLKMLFSNENEAKLLCWHSEERVIDGKLRHVADSPQWRNIDNKYPEFGNEMRNIRFGLSSDGINPFGNMSSRHSTYFYVLPNNSNCVFFDPEVIKDSNVQTNPVVVIKHIKEIFLHHKKKYFLAPYIKGKHWTLFIIDQETKISYILDSLLRPSNNDNYPIISIIDNTLSPNTYTWIPLKCNKQKNSWECGYLVIKHMHEFVVSIQHDIYIRVWSMDKIVLVDEIEKMLLNLIPDLIVNEFKSRMNMVNKSLIFIFNLYSKTLQIQATTIEGIKIVNLKRPKTSSPDYGQERPAPSPDTRTANYKFDTNYRSGLLKIGMQINEIAYLGYSYPVESGQKVGGDS